MEFQFLRVFWFVLLVASGSALSGPLVSIPNGTSFKGEFYPAQGVRFLYDKTFLNADNEQVMEHEIFDQLYGLIKQSTRLVLVDMFLFNDFKGSQASSPRPLAEELTQALLQKKANFPECDVILITDPVNTVYGGVSSPYLARLKEAGVQVVITDLEQLPDSNRLYSPLWRTLFASKDYVPKWRLPNPFDEGKVPLASILSLINFKANHRKVAIGINDQEMTGIVGSANPHDGSGAHENLAVRFSGQAVVDLLRTERTVVAFSGGGALPLFVQQSQTMKATEVTLRVITEHAIKEAVLDAVNESMAGDAIDIAMFYLSERDIIAALGTAKKRGVVIRLLLDPNKNAFGRERSGIPNRSSAHELAKQGILIRWCLTQGEQCHSKMLLARYKGGESRVILGSANYTRRNIDGFNLETNMELRGPSTHQEFENLTDYFESRWRSTKGRKTSLEYSVYRDADVFKYWQYRLMESSGLSTF
ncbi:MAG: phospholipase [Gammaproteobacteria bacterium]|nr:phospholipase [Gammaproteobacteria bacterium]